MCASVKGVCPYFAGLEEMAAAALAHPSDRRGEMMGYFPCLPEGGQPLLPYAQHPWRAPAQRAPLAAPQVHRSLGRGTVGDRYLEHGAPSCDRC